MFSHIYIEEAIRRSPIVQQIVARFPKAELIPCQRYGEVFNPKHQSFRLQKRNPRLILARKHGALVSPTPPGYGIGAKRNYYFSHMLNCLYDCRYCFLQGMYRSANFVLFVNFEDFKAEINRVLDEHGPQDCFFFSGYDCDSLAMEPVSQFCRAFLPFFARRPQAGLELRTKSVRVSPLLETEPLPNVVVAFSLNADDVARNTEHGAPSVSKRLAAAAKLADAGWPIGLRFDPLILFPGAEVAYGQLLEQCREMLPSDKIHSVTIGSFRAPRKIFKRMEALYPEEPLFMANLRLDRGQIGYPSESIREFQSRFAEKVAMLVPAERIFQNSQPPRVLQKESRDSRSGATAFEKQVGSAGACPY